MTSSFLLQLLLSVGIVLHFGVLLATWVGQRGASYLGNTLSEYVGVYTAFGNWRADESMALSIANESQLRETLMVEVHREGDPAEQWVRLACIHGKASSSSEDSRELVAMPSMSQRWLQQLSWLLIYGNDEGVGRLLMAALSAAGGEKSEAYDQLRVRVGPRLSIEQYDEVYHSPGDGQLPAELLPQLAYEANVIDLGEGQISLLPKLEQRRASKALLPSGVPSSGASATPSTPKL
jgi:hypothetical protein